MPIFVLICQVAKRDGLVSGFTTKISAATATDIPRIIFPRHEDGEKKFQIVIESNPAFNVHFDYREVDITSHSRFKNRNEELVEIRHQCLSKLYELHFENIYEKEAFLGSANLLEYPRRALTGRFFTEVR